MKILPFPRSALALFLPAAALNSIVSLSAHAQISAMGFVPGRASTYAAAVSADGSAATGYGYNTSGSARPLAFRWRKFGGMEVIPLPAGAVNTQGFGLSGDGSTIVGTGYNSTGTVTQAFRWTAAGGSVGLGGLITGANSIGTGISAGGTTISGYSAPANNSAFAIEWTSATQWLSLGAPSNVWPGIDYPAVSLDGSTIVGAAAPSNGSSVRLAYRKRETGGFENLGLLPGGASAWAFATNNNGSVVVGQALSGSTTVAMRWTQATGMVALPMIPGSTQMYALAVSGDGSVIVGGYRDAIGNSNAFLWTAALGSVDLLAHAASLHISMGNWILFSATGISADGKVIVGQGRRGTVLPEGFMLELNADSDGDGLFDNWEDPAGGIPMPNGQFYNLYNLGARANRKDIFVEVDAMSGMAPSQAVLDQVVAAFDTAPVAAPAGLAGGQPGIALHPILSDLSIPVASFPNTWTDFNIVKNGDPAIPGDPGFFGTAAERADPNWANIKAAKRQAFRYCIFAHSYGGGTSSGIAELPGNDFMVTLGAWPTIGGTDDQKAGTFMHEMGHTLGLHHGGSDDINFKPNYYSIMNYMWQLPSNYGTTGPGGTWRLSYSETALAALNELALNEAAGIGGNHPGLMVPYSVPVGSGSCTTLLGPGCVRFATFSGPVDWNNDSTTNAVPVQVNINYIRDNASAFPPGQFLTGFEDWSAIVYSFRESSNYADGAFPAVVPNGEMTLQEYQSLLQIPPPRPPCLADITGIGGPPSAPDGLVTGDDFNAFIGAFAASEPLADITGIGGPPATADGLITGDDFNAFIATFANGCP